MKNIAEDGTLKDLSRLPDENFCIFTLDSVGHRECKKAKTPNIDKLGRKIPAWSHAYYTTPSVYAMFRGALPQPFDRDTYWPLGRFSVTGENTNIPDTLSGRRGWNTYLYSSNPVITNERLKTNGDVISHNPYFMHEFNNNFETFSSDALVKHFLKNVQEKFFVFFLVIETHTPYLGRDKKNITQVRAIELVDKSIGKLINGIKAKKFKNKTRMIITSDHSEAWDLGNKERNYGHNPRYLNKYHNMVKMDRLTKVFIVDGYI